MFEGVHTAIITPFTKNGAQVDYEALDALVERQIAGGVQGLVPCGTIVPRGGNQRLASALPR